MHHVHKKLAKYFCCYNFTKKVSYRKQIARQHSRHINIWPGRGRGRG